MRKLLSLPVNMSLSAAENQVYQNALKYIPDLSLNLMAVKVTNRPEDFLGWCGELIRLCRDDLNIALLDDEQFAPLKKLQTTLETGFTISQFKMARIAPWAIYVDFIEQQNTLQALDERLRLMAYIDDLRHTPLAELVIEDRLAFAGKHVSAHDPSIYNFDVEWFAGTKGAKVFHSLLEQSPEKFDQALAHIPLTGEVNFDHYQRFVSDFEEIFSTYTAGQTQTHKPPLAAATRLLSMRRPDQFIALTNAKIDILCQGLSIAKLKNTDFSSYWHDMIGTMRTFAWWHQPAPETQVHEIAAANEEQNNEGQNNEDQNNEVNLVENREYTLWKNRAILIDLFIFADSDLAKNSHYLRLRDKALNKNHDKGERKTKSVIKKRGKESAEMLVDKALAADDLPAYLIDKRDAIVNQVKEGKSVEQAISLFRAIFG